MQVRKITVSDELPIPLDAAKKALRIDHAFEDDVVERKLRAAVEFVEERTGLVLRPTTFRASLGRWPFEGEVRLEQHPVRDVVAVRYLGAGGGPAIEVPGDDYDWRILETGAEVYFFSSWSFPALLDESRDPVTIEFEAGYDEPAEDAGDDPEYRLPSRVEELVLLLAGHWFKNREATTSGTLADVPYSAGLLIKELRIFR